MFNLLFFNIYFKFNSNFKTNFFFHLLINNQLFALNLNYINILTNFNQLLLLMNKFTIIKIRRIKNHLMNKLLILNHQNSHFKILQNINFHYSKEIHLFHVFNFINLLILNIYLLHKIIL